MSLRREANLHLSAEVLRALWLLSRAESNRNGQNITVDEITDNILRNHINDKYPQLFEHQSRIDKLEKELLKTLK